MLIFLLDLWRWHYGMCDLSGHPLRLEHTCLGPDASENGLGTASLGSSSGHLCRRDMSRKDFHPAQLSAAGTSEVAVSTADQYVLLPLNVRREQTS